MLRHPEVAQPCVAGLEGRAHERGVVEVHEGQTGVVERVAQARGESDRLGVAAMARAQERVAEQRHRVHDQRHDRRERQRLVQLAEVGAPLDELAAEEQADAHGDAREQQRGGARRTAGDPEQVLSGGDGHGDGSCSDWLVVTADGLLEELELSSEELEVLESSDEPVESSDDALDSSDDVVVSSDELV